MVPRLISAVDAVNPAIQRTRQLLLGPFRWAVWWRLALIAMVVSGEIYGNLVRIPDLLNATRSARTTPQDFAARANIWSDIFSGMGRGEMAMIIAILVVLFLALIVVHIYIMSVVRFILFDFATTGRYRLREGWRRWQAPGQRLFGFNMLLFLVFGSAAGLIVAGILLAVVRGGWRPQPNPVLIIFGVLFGFALIFLLAIIAYVFSVLIYDFSVPMMALEPISAFTALGRAWRLLKSAKGDCAAYVGLKFAISIGIGLVLSILNVVILLFVVLVGAIVVGVIGISVPNIFSNPVLLAAIITVTFFVFLVLSFVFALLVVPMLVFFQSYAVIFLAPRFLPLYYMMYGPPPEAAPPAPPAMPDEPPPFPPELAPTS